jgi:hypothetical protein
MNRRTREQWLNAMTAALRPSFKAAGHPIPEAIRISCGWPSHRALASASGRNIGQCWPATASADAHAEIFISPCIATSAAAGTILVHELCHAADRNEHGHKAPFKRIALAVGLTGKMRETIATPELTRRLNAIAEQLGDYPHATLDRSGEKKQGTRMLKVQCPECGYTVRTTAQWLAEGLPTCPCGTEMEQAE